VSVEKKGWHENECAKDFDISKKKKEKRIVGAGMVDI
jgi:hypothetical protein